MRYIRCKCGERIGWTSDGTAPCDGCSECNTTLETHPSLHRTPVPHDLVERYDGRTGKPYKRCRLCGYKEKEAA